MADKTLPALNPDLLDTGTPPIPQAQGWARAYDGRSGPLVDLSQAVPGSPPPAALLERLPDFLKDTSSQGVERIRADARRDVSAATSLSAPMSGSASGKCSSKNATMPSRVASSLLNILNGANSVHVKLPSWLGSAISINE